MGKIMKKMPDGSFVVDGVNLEIERSSKAPFIPEIKIKGGKPVVVGSTVAANKVPKSNGTGGYTWSDPACDALLVHFTADGQGGVTADKTPAEVKAEMTSKIISGVMQTTGQETVVYLWCATNTSGDVCFCAVGASATPVVTVVNVVENAWHLVS